jgi:hypothetical protein
MSDECRNPECRDGFTPGIITGGKGTVGMPIVGATMRWGWVKCRACNAEKDHPYQQVKRSPAEIAERARLADAKAKYEPVRNQPEAPVLEKLAAASFSQKHAPSPSLDERLGKLLDQNEKLTNQIAALLDENRDLRSQLSLKPKPRNKKKHENGETIAGVK